MSGQYASERDGASVADLCARWISIDGEIEQLTGRWSALEVMVLGSPPDAGGRSGGAAEEMALIDDRLAVLDADKASCTEALAKTSARSFSDVVGKLDVATRILSGEGGLVHDMVADAVTHLPRFVADRPDIP
jgi:hypothetical protein